MVIDKALSKSPSQSPELTTGILDVGGVLLASPREGAWRDAIEDLSADIFVQSLDDVALGKLEGGRLQRRVG